MAELETSFIYDILAQLPTTLVVPEETTKAFGNVYDRIWLKASGEAEMEPV